MHTPGLKSSGQLCFEIFLNFISNVFMNHFVLLWFFLSCHYLKINI